MTDSWITKGLCPSPYGCQMLKCAWKFHCQFAFLSILLEQVGLNRAEQSPGMTFSIWPLKLMTSQALQGAKIIAISFNYKWKTETRSIAFEHPWAKALIYADHCEVVFYMQLEQKWQRTVGLSSAPTLVNTSIEMPCDHFTVVSLVS